MKEAGVAVTVVVEDELDTTACDGEMVPLLLLLATETSAATAGATIEAKIYI